MSHDYLRSSWSVITWLRVCVCALLTHIGTPARPTAWSLTCRRSAPPIQVHLRFGTFGTSSDVFAGRLDDPDGFNCPADRCNDKHIWVGVRSGHSWQISVINYTLPGKVALPYTWGLKETSILFLCVEITTMFLLSDFIFIEEGKRAAVPWLDLLLPLPFSQNYSPSFH